MPDHVLASTLPAAVQTKLLKILASKAQRAGEYCLPFDPTQFPFSLRTLFPEFSRYALEIGCGWGEYTRASAQAHPDTLVIAVEKKLARVIASSRTQRAEGISNIRYLVLDLAWFFDGVFAEAQFDAITINFPDPWPKARHHKHRFVSPDFGESLSRIARPGARLTFATDNYPYAREAMETFEASADWHNAVAPWIAVGDIAGRPRSFFETVHRQEGAPIYFLQYDRK
ncbi:MAG TPA: tRNA (guanine-N7)-methyltransferase [Turneriella sp.]|nr:tRNA (guanine-N7)-methyltransferase [Turneriella sp.]